MECCGVAYVIKSGDTLSEIAERFLGSAREWRRIMAFNNDAAVLAHGGARIRNADFIRAGDTIRIPVRDDVAAKAKQPVAVPTAPPAVASPVSRSLVSLRTPRSDIFAYLNVYWDVLDDLPLNLIVGAVMRQVPGAAALGADATERFIQEWLISIDRRIADQTFRLDIPKISAPKDVTIGGLRLKWAPVPADVPNFANPTPPDGKLDVKGAFGTLSLTHFKLEKLKVVGLKVPVSKSVTLNSTLTPWSSIGFGGAWKTKGDFPDLEIGTTLHSANFSDDWSATYSFGVKNIKLTDELKADFSTSGPFDDLQSQSFSLKLKMILK